MYFDIEVRLTQGWFAYARDLIDFIDAQFEQQWLMGRGIETRIVSHIVAL